MLYGLINRKLKASGVAVEPRRARRSLLSSGVVASSSAATYAEVSAATASAALRAAALYTTAVALLDRLLHHSVVVVTSGDSCRMKEARQKGVMVARCPETSSGWGRFVAADECFYLALDAGPLRVSPVPALPSVRPRVMNAAVHRELEAAMHPPRAKP